MATERLWKIIEVGYYLKAGKRTCFTFASRQVFIHKEYSCDSSVTVLNIFYFQLGHADKEDILCVTTHSNNSLKCLERQTFEIFFSLSQYVNVNLNK